MLELELKAVVDDLGAARAQAERAGARLVFHGMLRDRRYDTADRALASRDHVLRLRTYHPEQGEPAAHLDWKGATAVHEGFKQREELSVPLGSATTIADMLDRLGYGITMSIDREIWQYELGGAVIRFERYPRMDDLVEVEGSAEDIEQAIRALGMRREKFTAERLADFARRYESRTGQPALVAEVAADGVPRYDWRDA